MNRLGNLVDLNKKRGKRTARIGRRYVVQHATGPDYFVADTFNSFSNVTVELLEQASGQATNAERFETQETCKQLAKWGNNHA